MLSLLAEKANRDVVDILLARPDLTPAHCLLIARQSQFIALILARRGHEPAIVAGLEAMGVEIPRVELQWRQQQNWLREQASLPDPHRRQVAAADQDTPSEVLLALVDDPDEWVMIGLESNPMLPPEVERKMREKGRVPRSRSPG